MLLFQYIMYSVSITSYRLYFLYIAYAKPVWIFDGANVVGSRLGGICKLEIGREYAITWNSCKPTNTSHSFL